MTAEQGPSLHLDQLHHNQVLVMAGLVSVIQDPFYDPILSQFYDTVQSSASKSQNMTDIQPQSLAEALASALGNYSEENDEYIPNPPLQELPSQARNELTIAAAMTCSQQNTVSDFVKHLELGGVLMEYLDFDMLQRRVLNALRQYAEHPDRSMDTD